MTSSIQNCCYYYGACSVEERQQERMNLRKYERNPIDFIDANHGSEIKEERHHCTQ